MFDQGRPDGHRGPYAPSVRLEEKRSERVTFTLKESDLQDLEAVQELFRTKAEFHFMSPNRSELLYEIYRCGLHNLRLGLERYGQQNKISKKGKQYQ
jgi:hypothetical protein